MSEPEKILSTQEDFSATMYGELKKIARSHRRKWSGNLTLNTTSLIGEAWLKMDAGSSLYQDRTHFYATASRVMRQVLINYAERSVTQKRTAPDSSDEECFPCQANDFDMTDLLHMDKLLGELEKTRLRSCRILECRIFGGMTNQETAKALNLSVSTIKREWLLLSTWLYSEFHKQSANHDSIHSA